VPSSTSPDALTLTAPVAVTTNQLVNAGLALQGTGSVQAISVALSWNPSVVEPVGFVAAPGFTGGVTLSALPGTIDAALVGAHSSGIAGTIGTMQFHAIADGNPGFAVATIRARDSGNQPISVSSTPVLGVGRLPSVTQLNPPFPNPSRGATSFAIALAKAGSAELSIFGVDGRKVRTLLAGPQSAGSREVSWDGRDERGALAPPGIYYARLVTEGSRLTRRLVRLH